MPPARHWACHPMSCTATSADWNAWGWRRSRDVLCRVPREYTANNSIHGSEFSNVRKTWVQSLRPSPLILGGGANSHPDLCRSRTTSNTISGLFRNHSERSIPPRAPWSMPVCCQSQPRTTFRMSHGFFGKLSRHPTFRNRGSLIPRRLPEPYSPEVRPLMQFGRLSPIWGTTAMMLSHAFPKRV